MIRYLAISNLAVIESVSVEFEQSFNVLTGETGAGKSMLVGAVGLLLGGRASQRPGAHRRRPRHRRGHLRGRRRPRSRRQAGSDGAGPQPRLRRRPAHHVHAPSARSSPSSSSSTASTNTSCCSIRSRTCRCSIEWAGLGPPRPPPCAHAWDALTDAERTLERAAMDAGERAARLELVEFHLASCSKARLAAGEDDELAQTREVLRHAGRLTTLCGEAYAPALRRRERRPSRPSARSGSGSASWRPSTRCSPRTPRPATASRPSSRTWRSRCATTSSASTPRRRGCRRSRTGSR